MKRRDGICGLADENSNPYMRKYVLKTLKITV
jgi:hypothetical protein